MKSINELEKHIEKLETEKADNLKEINNWSEIKKEQDKDGFQQLVNKDKKLALDIDVNKSELGTARREEAKQAGEQLKGKLSSGHVNTEDYFKLDSQSTPDVKNKSYQGWERGRVHPRDQQRSDALRQRSKIPTYQEAISNKQETKQTDSTSKETQNKKDSLSKYEILKDKYDKTSQAIEAVDKVKETIESKYPAGAGGSGVSSNSQENEKDNPEQER